MGQDASWTRPASRIVATIRMAQHVHVPYARGFLDTITRMVGPRFDQ